jgi:hypothetical protein
MRAVLAFLATLAVASAALAQSDWQPSSDQIEQSRAAVDAYFTALEHNEPERAFAMMSAGTRAIETASAFSERARSFASISGALLERRFHRVTWYKDPADAPAPGVYVAFDMVAWFANIDRYCGYVIAYQAPTGGAFEIMRLEENYIDNKTAGGAGASAIWLQLAQSACPGWTEKLGNRAAHGT